jgi:hypothetical protein
LTAVGIDSAFVCARNARVKHTIPLRRLEADLAMLGKSLAFWQAQSPIEVAAFGYEVRSAQIEAIKAVIIQTEEAIRILEADNT